jgi:hypothetical protein
MNTGRINVVNFGAGVCFVALGILLLLEKGDVVEMQYILRLWPVALVIMGGAVAWQSSRGEPVSGASFGLLFWILVLGLLFNHTFNRREAAQRPEGDGTVNVFALMSGDRRPGVTGEFNGGQITNVMAGSRLDLRNSTMAPGDTAVIDVFTVFGGSTIFVPREWEVEIRTTSIAGGTNDDRGPRPGKDEAGTEATDGAAAPSLQDPVSPETSGAAGVRAPKLILQGFVMFGGINIKS